MQALKTLPGRQREVVVLRIFLDLDTKTTARVLGVTPGMGKALGVDEKWAYTIVKQVGNYGESFDRNLGMKSPIKIDRGLNKLWKDGGLMYAPPVR